MTGTAHRPADRDVPLWELTLGELLAEAARDAGDATALLSGTDGRSWTFAELDALADGVAGQVAAILEPGDRLAVWSTGLPEWVLLQFGAARAGVTLVPLNPAYQAAELSHALRQSRARAMYHGPDVRGRSLREVVERVRPECAELRHVLPLEGIAELAAGAGRATVLPAVSASDPVMIQYTSGTTGKPKGAVLTHRGIVNNARLSALRAGVAQRGVWLNPLPMFHTGGCVFNTLGAMATRARHVLMPVWEPGAALRLIEQERVTFLCAVPTMLIDMIEHPDFGDRDQSTLRYVLSGGTAIPPELVRRIETSLEIDYTMVFGQTEAGPTVTMTHPGDSAEDKSGTIGQPLAHTEVKIVDLDTGDTAAVDWPGEIWVRGYGCMLGYFDLPEETRGTLEPDGWLRTGDIGQMDERGYLKITGRLKEIIRRGGETISPRAIEELLLNQPGVGGVAVLGVPDERYGEQIAAFLTPAAGQVLDFAVLRAVVEEQVARYKVPRYWVAVDEFPRTPSGKIQKFLLRDHFVAGRYAEDTVAPGRTSAGASG
jgi:fatty-acyl-CoA synthase